MAVTLKFVIGPAAVASVAVARAPAKASTIVEDVLVRNRRRIVSPLSRPWTGAMVAPSPCKGQLTSACRRHHSRRRVAMMKDQSVAVLVLEVGLVADAAVHRLALERNAVSFELGAGALDVLDVERDCSRARLELAADLGDVDDLDREAAGLELASERVVVALGALEAEHAAVERLRLLEARDRKEDEVGAGDEGLLFGHGEPSFRFLASPALTRRSRAGPSTSACSWASPPALAGGRRAAQAACRSRAPRNRAPTSLASARRPQAARLCL